MTPLEGVDVLDFTQVIAGPLCGRMLGDLGANVTKVEPPNGESTRDNMGGAYFSSYNTSKQSLCVDLKSERGQEAVRRGAEGADIILENFRPGVMARFGLDYQTVSSYNDEIVYCSISGYGQYGPYKDSPAYDPIIQAMSGLMERNGYPDLPPVRMGLPVIDMGTAAHAAFAVLAALRNRDATGTGEYIDVSLYDTAISWMTTYISYYYDTGEIPERKGRKGGDEFAPTAICRARGGELYLIAPSDRMFESLCSVIDREELLEDERFDTRESRSNHHDDLLEELETTFSEYDVQDIADALSSQGVPVAPVRDIESVVETDAQVNARDMILETANRTTGAATLIAQLPFRFENADVRTENPPKLGSDSASILSSWGIGHAEIKELVADGVIQSET